MDAYSLIIPVVRQGQVFLEVMNSVLMTGEIPGLFAKDEMMAMTADLRNSFLKVSRQSRVGRVSYVPASSSRARIAIVFVGAVAIRTDMTSS